MSKLEIHQIPVLNDNYVYLFRESDSGKVGVVDPAVTEPVLEKLAELGWKLTHIINTHHHGDHTGGNLALKEKTGCTIVGAKKDAARIPGIDIGLEDGDIFEFGSETARVFEVPGHTVGHIAYWFENSDALFCGDTLFALGCGRLFEGTPQQMWHSLEKFRALPDSTRVYCAHEYTEANGRFALSVEPDNAALKERFAEIVELRKRKKPTVPSTLGEEKATNPFLRADQPSLAAELHLSAHDPVEVFAETRRRKDSF
ncbi:MAG: hydroxyacylglutathione hydrolase [Sneathiella sp.]|uniref:hydroxyacylglutathione hydrolase n=1 Tax=Sneathiella sp. TaxID=1964365 RepID=UPI000C591F64|nr:hydroxyacylglutathione hydrolase [Sneathiella sp.]MAL79398.1 hydroxyacylglutathione hydrolase [Sneathiella sp.]